MLEDNFKDIHSYYIPRARKDFRTDNQEKWSNILSAFPSIQDDFSEALNCYEFECSTACVFHIMRIVECGLRAVAMERGIDVIGKNKKPLNDAQWGEILNAVESEKELIRRAPNKANASKRPATEFYQGIIAHGLHLKDRYRNCVMHSSRSFSDDEANDAMFHAKSLLEVISDKLSEDFNGPIDWGL